MSRPQRNIVFYFPHDAGASESDTLTVLESNWGNDGYAFWFKLLEKLSKSENHFFDARDRIKWNLLCKKARVSDETGIAIIETLAKLGTIDAELWQEQIIWSANLVANVADVYKNRRRPMPSKPTVSSINNAEIVAPAVETTITTPVPQSEVKDSEVNIVFTEVDTPPGDRADRIPYKEIVDLFNSLCQHQPRVLKLTERRKEILRARWKENPGIQSFEHMFKKVSASNFLNGLTDQYFICGFDWILKPSNWEKIMEGNYDNKNARRDASKVFTTVEEWRRQRQMERPATEEFDAGGERENSEPAGAGETDSL